MTIFTVLQPLSPPRPGENQQSRASCNYLSDFNRLHSFSHSGAFFACYFELIIVIANWALCIIKIDLGTVWDMKDNCFHFLWKWHSGHTCPLWWPTCFSSPFDDRPVFPGGRITRCLSKRLPSFHWFPFYKENSGRNPKCKGKMSWMNLSICWRQQNGVRVIAQKNQQ